LGVTAWITIDAIAVIRNPENDSVNVLFLFGFASANALVDIICSLLFYLRREDVLLNISHLPQEISPSQLTPDSTLDLPSDSFPVPRSVNLNMASALTHVTGDTLRTTAVMIAALVATVSNISGAVCDAWAAIIVTVTILFIVVPLVMEIYRHAQSHPFFSSNPQPASTEEEEPHPIEVVA
jgi:Co/Zn/Cd efflux system component